MPDIHEMNSCQWKNTKTNNIFVRYSFFKLVSACYDYLSQKDRDILWSCVSFYLFYTSADTTQVSAHNQSILYSYVVEVLYYKLMELGIVNQCKV